MRNEKMRKNFEVRSRWASRSFMISCFYWNDWFQTQGSVTFTEWLIFKLACKLGASNSRLLSPKKHRARFKPMFITNWDCQIVTFWPSRDAHRNWLLIIIINIFLEFHQYCFRNIDNPQMLECYIMWEIFLFSLYQEDNMGQN